MSITKTIEKVLLLLTLADPLSMVTFHGPDTVAGLTSLPRAGRRGLVGLKKRQTGQFMHYHSWNNSTVFPAMDFYQNPIISRNRNGESTTQATENSTKLETQPSSSSISLPAGNASTNKEVTTTPKVESTSSTKSETTLSANPSEQKPLPTGNGTEPTERGVIFNVLILSNQLNLAPIVKNCCLHSDSEDQVQEPRVFCPNEGDEFKWRTRGVPTHPPRTLHRKPVAPNTKNTTIVIIENDEKPSCKSAHGFGSYPEEEKPKVCSIDSNVDLDRLRDLWNNRHKLPNECGSKSDRRDQEPEMQEIAEFNNKNSSVIVVRINGNYDKNTNCVNDCAIETNKKLVPVKQLRLDPVSTARPSVVRKTKTKKDKFNRFANLAMVRPVVKKSLVSRELDKNISTEIQEMELHLTQLSKLMERIEKKKKLM